MTLHGIAWLSVVVPFLERRDAPRIA